MKEFIKNNIKVDKSGNVFVNDIPYGNKITKNFANAAELSDWWSANPKAVCTTQFSGINYPNIMEFVFPL